METILVAGGAGFIGSHLCSNLLKEGYKVILLDRFIGSSHKEIKEKNIRYFRKHPHLFLIDLDIQNINSLNQVFHLQKIDSLYHLAINGKVPDYIKNPAKLPSDNILTTSLLFQVAIKNKLSHIIYASSSLVYGLSASLPFRENDPCLYPTSPYAVTMRSNELLAHSYHHLYNTPFTGLRFFPIVGPNMREDLFLPTLIRSIINKKDVIIYGDGKTTRTYIWIDDIISAMIKLMTKPEGYQIINLGNDKGVSLLQLVALAERILGTKANLKFLPKLKEEIPKLYPSIEKAKNKIGFSPKYKIEEILKKYIDWYLGTIK